MRAIVEDEPTRRPLGVNEPAAKDPAQR